MSPDQLVSQNLERWKEHLLDTSKRNRLLFFAPQSAVQLLEPDLDTMWKRLVSGGKTLSFWGLESENDLFALDESESDEDEIAPPSRPLKADELRPNPRGAKLNRLLYGLRSKSNMSLEEQGLTTLYVAWGFLKWRDAKTQEEVVSPLILSPVTLLRESSRSSYRLRLSEETLWLNPVLEWKLATDYKIGLPAMPDFEDARPLDYFDAVRRLIVGRGWSVWEAAYLGLFSFHKMAMYKDLREGETLALSNPFVRALGGDASRLPPPIADLPCGAALDELPVRESFAVLDCDSSQLESIEAARAGTSFVLQGPPGTGKSQTITNIIAHALAEGKRVLFVSEKMAALDVVHSRLEAVGLGPFCLKAHSQSATKKQVLADLGKTLLAARTGAEMATLGGALRQDDADADELERLRAGLNFYARELHAPRSALKRSVYEVVGELARRPGAREVAASLPSPFATDAPTLNGWRDLLQAAQESQGVWRAGASHPWHGVRARPFSLDLLTTIRSRGANAARLSRALLEQSRQSAQSCGLSDTEFSLARAPLLPSIVALLRELQGFSSRPPAMWFVAEDLESHFALAQMFKARFSGVRARRLALEARYEEPFWALPHEELIERSTTRHAATLSRAGTWERFPEWASELTKRLDTAALHLARAARLCDHVAAQLDLTPPKGLSQIGGFANALGTLEEMWRVPRAVAPHFFDPAQTASLLAYLERARSQNQSRSASAAALEGYDLQALEGADIGAMRSRFETQYSGFFRFLKGAFKRDLAQLASWRRDQVKPSYEAALADLNRVLAWQNAHIWLRDEAPAHAQQFGAGFGGQSTDWDALETDLKACAAIANAFAPLGGLSPTLATRLASGAQTGAPPELVSLRESLVILRDELPRLQAIFSLRDMPFQKDGVALGLSIVPALPLAAWLHEQSVALKDVEAAFSEWTTWQKDPNPAPETLVADAREALDIQRDEANLQTESEELRSCFDTLFCGQDTDWDALIEALSWTSRVLEWWKKWERAGGRCGENGGASAAFVALATGETRFSAPDAEWAEDELRAEWEFFADLFETSLAPNDDLGRDSRWFQERAASASLLEEWLRWRQVSAQLQSAGLWPFWGAARHLDLEGVALLDAFEVRFWSLWLDSALEESPSLGLWNGVSHRVAARKFRELDARALGAAQRRLGEILWHNKPSVSVSAAKTGEIATLQKEVNKKARQWPVRKLFREIPHLLGALKPCLLLSPLSVAQFLEAGRAGFDLVIFDEASQICPEDAVGAILRSKQLIVVGDRRQLPPSRFFASGGALDGDEDDESDEGALFESILDMCAPHLPGFMLLWHYRSRDESLISFSNQHFYDGRLITFPGPFAGSQRGRGVRLETVNGLYYRGKHPRARTNPREAAHVAKLIIEHVREAPGQSLGVIALNATQGRAIEMALYDELGRAPQLEEWFGPHKKEAFFIKALENVQGDERDAIILSIGFGPDENGKISLNFGPLNKEGGERRLNVAVTRAKESLTVVSSLAPEAIDPVRTNKLGPRLLRAYLEAARRSGEFVPLEAGATAENDALVHAVEAALRARGWTTRRAIGRSALKIDIGVDHPEREGEFLLGIECDGGDTASALVARDRERIRPHVLESMGWNLESVQSLDWIKNPDAEIARLEAVLQRALAPAVGQTADLSTPVPLLDALPDDTENLLGEVSFEELPSDSFPTTTQPNGFDFQFASLEDEAPVESVAVTDGPNQVPESREYRAVELPMLGWQDGFHTLSPQSPTLLHALWCVAEVEAPLHFDALVFKVARAWGFGRAGELVASKIHLALQHYLALELRGAFVWKRGQSAAPFRVPPPGNAPRSIEQIAPEEIADAMLYCVREAVGLERDDLVRQTARTLGFSRTGAQITASLQRVLETLLRENKLCERAGAIGIGGG